MHQRGGNFSHKVLKDERNEHESSTVAKHLTTMERTKSPEIVQACKFCLRKIKWIPTSKLTKRTLFT